MKDAASSHLFREIGYKCDQFLYPSNPDENAHLSVTGRAKVLRDVAKNRELWRTERENATRPVINEDSPAVQ